jgi:hypothetical protein
MLPHAMMGGESLRPAKSSTLSATSIAIGVPARNGTLTTYHMNIQFLLRFFHKIFILEP